MSEDAAATLAANNSAPYPKYAFVTLSIVDLSQLYRTFT